MNTVIITQNGKSVVIPNSDWYLKNGQIMVRDQINETKIVGNFKQDNIAGVYTDNPVRLKAYEPDDEE